MINENDLNSEDNTATYCPEDNKLRLYVDNGDGRVERDTYLHLRKLGFKATPKQSCSFVATWSAAAEDAVLSLISEYDDIGDEDYSPQERAADRAERFANYRDKRRGEATGQADAYDSGPSAYGYQNQSRADRAAKRHESHRTKALSQWSKAEYWATRTNGVIANALHVSKPAVRRSRILKLQAEIRGIERNYKDSQDNWDAWSNVAKMDDPDKQTAAAKWLSGNSSSWRGDYPHPDNPEILDTLYNLLDPDLAELRTITGAEACKLFLERNPERPDPANSRRKAHLDLRVAYELQMIGESGGRAADDDIQPGGFFGKWQVTKANKSKADGRVVSILARNIETGEVTPKAVNLDRMQSGGYRSPTAEELEGFGTWKREQTAKTKKANASKPKLYNPTPETARKLQEILNANEGREDRASEVLEITQKTYSANSGGSYSRCETVLISEKLQIIREHWSGSRGGRVGVFKVRVCSNGFNAKRVIVITDKPQKPLPFDLVAEIHETMPKPETHAHLLRDFVDNRSSYGYEFRDAPAEKRDELIQLREDFGYLGWACVTCSNQFDLTDAGVEVYRAQERQNA